MAFSCMTSVEYNTPAGSLTLTDDGVPIVDDVTTTVTKEIWLSMSKDSVTIVDVGVDGEAGFDLINEDPRRLDLTNDEYDEATARLFRRPIVDPALNVNTVPVNKFVRCRENVGNFLLYL